MKYFFSLLERKSFVKIFSLCLLSFILLTGFSYSQESNNSLVLESFLKEFPEETINLFPPKKVSLIYANEKIDILTYEENVLGVLDSYGLIYNEHDIITPGLDYEIKNNHLIKVVLVDKFLYEETEDIPFQTKRVEDSNLNYGQEVVTQIGVMGIKKITYEEVFENDKLVKTRIYKTEIVKKAADKIINFGTKKTVLGRSDCTHWFGVINNSTSNENERRILKSLIKCESNCNDSKSNRNIYIGLLQFSRNTFNHYGNGDIWDGEQQILAALKIIRSGGLSHHWPACSRNIN